MNDLKNLIIEKYNALMFLLGLFVFLTIFSGAPNKIAILFLFIILNFIFQILDTGMVILLSMSLGILLGLYTSEALLVSFSQNIIWQIMCFLFLSKSLIKSGLAYKISLYIMYFFGKSPLSLSYGFALITVGFSLILPTSSARVGGIFIPILTSLFSILSKDDEKLKSVILKTIVYCNAVASAMFITASSGNFYVQEVTKSLNVFISTKDWTFYSLLPGFVCILLLPYFINFLIEPKTRNFKKLNKKIEEELTNIEEFSYGEIIILTLFTSLFPLIFLANIYNFSFLAVLFSIVSFLILFDLLSFEQDVLQNSEAWSLFFWMSHLLFLSSLITAHQSLTFVSLLISQILSFLPSNMILLGTLTLYGYSQYFFASSTVHASALYVLSFEIAVQNGYNPFLSALLLAYISNLFAGLTTYSASEVILLTSTFECDSKEFNKYGLIISTFIFVIWLFFGMIWWKITGVM